MAYYKLIDAIHSPQKLNVVGNIDGAKRYVRVTLYPGKKYEIPEDELLWKSISETRVKTKYDKALEAALKAANVDFKVKHCPSCSGRILKIEYPIVEVCDA
jgi:hypothetical protein